MLKLYNTLSRKKEVFKPIKNKKVGLYTCGPTVYGPGHLGHARSYTNFDLLKRVLLYNGFKVKHILNITDVHDDMIKKAKESGINISQLANRYIPLFKKDLADLNIVPANLYPRVTDHILEIIQMIKVLINKGYAYVEKDGSVYFDISKFKNYGKLSGIRLKKTKAGTRVRTDKYEKAAVADFALWKGYKEGEPYWSSPWEKGRPGWHIECSVMAKKYLGKTIDIHAGAMDLKFPHHENEIAQSEAANGTKFVNYWFHVGLLEVNNQKMSKSLGNYIEIHQIKERGVNPLVLRYLFLTCHYPSKLNFTWKGLKATQSALNNLYQKVREIKESEKKQVLRSKEIKSYQKKFLNFINDDLNIPKALALMWEVVKSPELLDKEKYYLLLNFDKVFGLNLAKIKKPKISAEIKKLVEMREKLRTKKKWQEADEIRKKIKEMGYWVEDTRKGPKIKKV